MAAIHGYSKTHSVNDTVIFVEKLLGLDTPKDDHGHWFKEEGAPCPHGEENSKNNKENTFNGNGTKEMKCTYGHKKSYGGGYGIEKQYDVTDEYKKEAAPGTGSFYVMNNVNVKDNTHEIALAEKVQKELGGDFIVLAESGKANEENPDYFWRKGLWDLKTPKLPTWNAIDKRTEKGLTQTKPNMSGIIFSMKECKLSIDEAIPLINDSINNRAKKDLDVIVFNKDESDYRVIRYKIKKASNK